MKKKLYYAIELANIYERSTTELVAGLPIDAEPSNEVLLLYERLDNLAEIWDEISYCLSEKWHT